MPPTVAIFGAGMTGLAAGRELIRYGFDVDVYEASDHIGGLASTFRDNNGFVYDNGPRFIFSTLAEKIGITDICEPVKYYEHMYVKGKYYLFPFGFIRNPKYCFSVGTSMLTRSLLPKPKNLGQFLRTYYGRSFSKEVLMPLIEKWSGVPADEMSIDFASRLLPTNISYVIHSLVKKLRGGVTEDYYKAGRYIVYPKGSNSKIFEALAQTPGLNIHFHAPLKKFVTKNSRIDYAIAGNKKIFADCYLSTIPISKVVNLFDNPQPIQHWNQFTYRGILNLFIKLNRKKVLEGLWSWFPEDKFKFYRISEYKNALPELAPPDKTLLGVEIACNESDPYWSKNGEEILTDIMDDLKMLYGLQKNEILGIDLKKSPCAYPVLQKSTERDQRKLTHHTPLDNFFIAGRIGMFQYRMLEGCYESALSCAEVIKASSQGLRLSTQRRIDKDAYGRPLIAPD